MSQIEKFIEKLLLGKSDNNFRFNDICNLLVHFGFEMRIKGSHHIFRKEGIPKMLNLQKDGDLAKNYQIKQVRMMLIEYKEEIF